MTRISQEAQTVYWYWCHTPWVTHFVNCGSPFWIFVFLKAELLPTAAVNVHSIPDWAEKPAAGTEQLHYWPSRLPDADVVPTLACRGRTAAVRLIKIGGGRTTPFISYTFLSILNLKDRRGNFREFRLAFQRLSSPSSLQPSRSLGNITGKEIKQTKAK